MRKSTKAIAAEMNLQPISVLTALKLFVKGCRPGMCFGYKKGKGIRAWKTKQQK